GIHLTRELIANGFDVGCSFKLHHVRSANHAFVRTVLYLDYDQRGFDYPVLPFHVNCYGQDLWNMLKERPVAGSPPPAPAPWRCYDLGKTVARILQESPWRVAVIGSSSWSHAFNVERHHGLFPDVERDRERLKDVESGDLRSWRDLDTEAIRFAGQQE